MPVKFSQLPPLTVVDGTVVVPIVDVSGVYTSKKTTVNAISQFVLQGNAATASKLQTPVTINGVSFDGSANISIVTPLTPATTTELGAVIIGDGIDLQIDGTISVLPATANTLGGVKVGSGLNLQIDGTISAPLRKFHGFSVEANGDLIYSSTTTDNISLQDSYGEIVYKETDIGTDDYSYSVDNDGNLIVTFT